MAEIVNEPVEVLRCPACNAIIPLFKSVGETKCKLCGAIMIRVSVEREYVLRVLGGRGK